MKIFLYILLGMPCIAKGETLSAGAKAACLAIAGGSAETLSYPLDSLDYDYVQAKTHYWSAANADLTPACVVFPATAEEVSNVVHILQNYTDVGFAMKSGGHNPNVGFSSTDGGVLISFSKLATTTYNAGAQTADIGPGARWAEVMSALEPYGVAVVGGRIGDVGVGGLLLGGGLSFMSGQYGLPCDNIVNYEVVLSDGTIVNANSNTNVDLFWALKGGGNQFGMVTKFTMTTVPIGQIWGGTRVYSMDKASALINATHDFIENYTDPRAGVIVTGEIAIDTLVQLFVVFFFYNGETPPPGVFDKFNAIENTVDLVKVQAYADMLIANNDYNIYGLRYLIRGTTLPNLPGTTGKDLYNYHFESWKAYVFPKDLTTLLNLGFIFSMAFQPMPYAIPAASQKVNPMGNALGLSPEFGDHVWMEYDISWLTAPNDNLAHSMAMNITSSIDAYAQRKYAGVLNSHYKSGNVMWEEYNPTFLNDAMYDQKPLQSYGQARYDRLKRIQKTYDPSGLFPTRTGGFKFV